MIGQCRDNLAVPNSNISTGLLNENGNSLYVPGAVPDRPLSLAWMTDELIADTQRVWSPYYGYHLTVDEAVEILRNVKRFAESAMTSLRSRRQR